jgi:aspartate/methionine/tyrosine aminotransferase
MATMTSSALGRLIWFLRYTAFVQVGSSEQADLPVWCVTNLEGRAVPLIASNRGMIPPFFVMEMLRAANECSRYPGKVIHLEVGQPSTSAPRAVLEAASRALASEHLGYTDCRGIPVLRRSIARYYRTTYGIDVSDREVFITTGSSAGFLLAFLAAFDLGDRVALVTPGYPAYRNILSALGLEPVLITTGPAYRYQLHPDLLSNCGAIKGLIIASPSNPTGAMIDQDTLSALYRWCEERGVRLISDEIYHGITFDRSAQTVRSLGQNAIIVNSFSKYFSMTGWRLGWMIVPDDLARSIECLAQNFHISPPTLSQVAATLAFESTAELDGHVARYRRNRDILLRGLSRATIKHVAPSDGAFYLYADVSHLTTDSLAFCRRLLAETGVAIAPGVDFDPIRGGRTIRFSFAGATEEIEEAITRLVDWTAMLKSSLSG